MPTIDETLTLLRCSVPDPDPSIPEYTEEVLERKRQGLIEHACVLIQHEENLNKAVTEFEIQVLQIQTRLFELKRLSVLPDALVHFVSLLEVANQFFEFIGSAKQVYDFERAYSSMDIERTLLLHQQLTSKFNKLGKMEILLAAQAIVCQVYDKQSGTKRINPNELDWIHRLVYKARVEGYVMDQNPSVELEKMMKFEPVVYDRYFTKEPLPVKCTEKSTEEAHKKYSQLVTTILAKSEESFNEKLTSTATGARNLKQAKDKLITASNAKRPFVMTGATGKVAKAKVMLSGGNGWAPMPPQTLLRHP